MGLTFGLTVIAWIFFRSGTVSEAFNIISKIFSKSLFSIPYSIDYSMLILLELLILFLIIIEWIFRKEKFALSNLNKIDSIAWRWIIYLGLTTLIFIFRAPEKQDFIYFQF